MRIFAYCLADAKEVVSRALGVIPLTAPPLKASTFDPKWLEGYDLLYFRLHGLEAIPTSMFYEEADESFSPALNVRQIGFACLKAGSVVIMANCYGTESPFVRAFYQAGAAAVIAGPGQNWALEKSIVGPDLLARWLAQKLAKGLTVERAFSIAKTRLLLTSYRAADRDALGFKIMTTEAIV